MNSPNLQKEFLIGNNKTLTKNHERHSNVLNSAFFVPKIYTLSVSICMKNRIRISKYGRVNGQNKIPYVGNMFSRLVAISNTRPPVTKAGGKASLKPRGGHAMPDTSKRAAIRTIQTITTPSGIIATIHTRYKQKAVIGRLFTSFDQLKSFVFAQGLSLDLLGGRI